MPRTISTCLLLQNSARDPAPPLLPTPCWALQASQRLGTLLCLTSSRACGRKLQISPSPGYCHPTYDKSREYGGQGFFYYTNTFDLQVPPSLSQSIKPSIFRFAAPSHSINFDQRIKEWKFTPLFRKALDLTRDRNFEKSKKFTLTSNS